MQDKLERISCDRAPLVAHLLTASALMCIISDMQSVFFLALTSCRQLQLQNLSYLVFLFQDDRGTEGMKT